MFKLDLLKTIKQRWSPRGRPWPRGHILKSLALASKPQVLGLGLEPCVLDSTSAIKMSLTHDLLALMGQYVNANEFLLNGSRFRGTERLTTTCGTADNVAERKD